MHLFEGLVVSALSYLLILACLSVLAKTERTGKIVATRMRPPTAEDDAAASDAALARNRRRRSPRFRWASRCCSSARPTFGWQRSAAFPTRIGEWSLDTRPKLGRFPAIDDELVRAYPSPQGERHFIAIDDELVRAYRDSSGERVRLYIGYHRSQREGKELAGEASHLLNAAAMPIRLQIGSGTVEFGEVVHDASGAAGGAFCTWYDLNGRVFSSMYLAKQYMVWDALTRGRTNGAVVMVAVGEHRDRRRRVVAHEGRRHSRSRFFRCCRSSFRRKETPSVTCRSATFAPPVLDRMSLWRLTFGASLTPSRALSPMGPDRVTLSDTPVSH